MNDVEKKTRTRHGMTPARFRWGLFLVLIGVVLLLRNTGVVSWDFWWDWVKFFPVVLIAIGVEKIFTGSKLRFISYATSVFLFVGGLYLALAQEYRGGYEADVNGTSDFNLNNDASVQLVKATLDMRNTNLTVRDAGEKLMEARFHEAIRSPKVDYKIDDGVCTIDVSSRQREFWGGIVKIDLDELEDWYMQFSAQVPLELTCNSDASDIHLNLSSNPLRTLTVNSRNDNIYVKLGELVPEVHLEIRGDDASLRLRLPSNAGLRVDAKEYHDYFGQLGLREENGTYVSNSYETDPVKVNLEINDQLRQLSVDYY